MRINLKVAMAVLLVCSSLGVIGYNISYIRRNFRTDDTPESLMSPFPEPTGQKSEGMEATSDPHSTAPSEDSTQALPTSINENPLGNSWTDSPWNELVLSYMNQPSRENKETTTPDANPDGKSRMALPDLMGIPGRIGIKELEESLGRVEIRGVIIGGGRSLALVNGWLLQEGDALPDEPIYITEIKKEQIIFKTKFSDWMGYRRLRPIGSGRREHEHLQKVEEEAEIEASTEKEQDG